MDRCETPTISIQERVQKGIDLLNGVDLLWFEKVDPKTLAMSSCTRCVLGQIFGQFHTGLEQINLEEPAANYGFDRFNRGMEIGSFREFVDLKKEWVRRITELRAS
jgi:hypothetical protein